LLHYLPQRLFIKALKYINKYEEDIELICLSKTNTLLNKINLQSYSGKIIKNPSHYLMNAPAWLEKALNFIPLRVLDKLTFIHPTLIFVFKKKQ